MRLSWSPGSSLRARSLSALLVVPVLACGGGGASPTAPAPVVEPAAAPTPAPQRPNFIIVVTDDMAYGLFGAGKRMPFLELPNLDRIAAQGVQFDQAFVTTSLCSPSRATILSGKYAHSHGVRTNDDTDLSTAVTTFPQVLQQAGYKTAWIGKWHMDPRNDGPRPGFDRWVSFKGQGVYTDQQMNEDGVRVPRTGYTTDLLTDYAVSWLEQRGKEPFAMVVSHKAPHGPFTPAARHANSLADAQMAEPADFRDTFKNKPSWQRRYAMCGGAPTAMQGCPDPLPSELPLWQWSAREPWRLNYLRTLMSVDDGLGRMLQTLQARGLAQNTYVIFTSDNGSFLGEHRLGDKRLAYEESLRVPLVVTGPLVRARRSNGMVLNLDLAPTILELAGVTVPSDMQGRSLAPILKGDAHSVRDGFLYEYFTEGLIPVVPDIFALRTSRLKYVTYPGSADEELYDLALDPGEMTNLAASPDYAAARADARSQLDALLARSGAR